MSAANKKVNFTNVSDTQVLSDLSSYKEKNEDRKRPVINEKMLSTENKMLELFRDRI